MRQSLRRSGGSLVMSIPKAFIEQNGLTEGSQIQLHMDGRILTVEASSRPRYKLADLMAEMSEGFPLVEGWDKEPLAGCKIG